MTLLCTPSFHPCLPRTLCTLTAGALYFFLASRESSNCSHAFFRSSKNLLIALGGVFALELEELCEGDVGVEAAGVGEGQGLVGGEFLDDGGDALLELLVAIFLALGGEMVDGKAGGFEGVGGLGAGGEVFGFEEADHTEQSQNLNFWKYHLTRQAELTLWSAYKDLEDADKPRFWSRQLQNGNLDLGKNWKGSYAYVDRPVIHQIRRSEGHEKIIQDEFNGDHHDAFQSLRFESVNPDEGSMWPEIFERHLHSLSQPQHSRAKTRAQHRSASPTSLPSNQRTSFQFRGIGQDAEEDFEALGWINALPSQHGIPGWQRMTMMKYYWVDVETGVIDEEALWAYEGVVLPGGQVVVGRWWCTSDGVGEEMYSGPFILWCVDGPGDNEEEEMET